MTEKTVFYADYQAFTEAKKRIAEGEAESQGTTIKCHECDGAGETSRECCDNETHCEECNGKGYLTDTNPNPSPRKYFNESISLARKLASYKCTDFFTEAGKFIKFYEQQGLYRR